MSIIHCPMSFRPLALFAVSLALCAAAASASASPYNSAVLAQNPLEYWTLNDASKGTGATALDSAAHNNGTYSAGVTNVSPGAAFIGGTAAGFTGGSNVSFSNDATYLPAGGADRTLILWTKTSDASGMAFNYGTEGGGNLFGLYINSSGQANATNFGADAKSSVAVDDGSWHMIGVTVNGGTWTVYSDVLGVMTPGTPNAISTNTTLGGRQQSIGGAFSFFGGSAIVAGFNGSIDEVALFGTALTQGNLQTIYNAAFVPEPSALVLLSLGSLGVLLVRRRRRRA